MILTDVYIKSRIVMKLWMQYFLNNKTRSFDIILSHSGPISMPREHPPNFDTPLLHTSPSLFSLTTLFDKKVRRSAVSFEISFFSYNIAKSHCLIYRKIKSVFFTLLSHCFIDRKINRVLLSISHCYHTVLLIIK